MRKCIQCNEHTTQLLLERNGLPTPSRSTPVRERVSCTLSAENYSVRINHCIVQYIQLRLFNGKHYSPLGNKADLINSRILWQRTTHLYN